LITSCLIIIKQMSLSETDIAELGCTYAALILHDDNIPISGEKIKKLLDAANVKVAPFWPNLFANALNKTNIDDLILNSGAGGGGGATTTVQPIVVEEKGADKGGKDKGGKQPKEEKKKEDKPESDEDMGFGLFD